MALHNFAAYKSGTFSIDVSNLTIADKFFEPKDMPAFIHEYCHFIQDITTISSIFGFSLWMRDIVALTKIFSDGEGKVIPIPLDRDVYGQTVNKFRKYYNLYCGDPNKVFEIDYNGSTSMQRHLTMNDIDLDGEVRKLAVNEIELSNRADKLFFGLIVLQEIHAYYAQVMAEEKLPKVEFSVYTKDLPSYPYKFGDFLFKHYNIEIDVCSKFILIDLCLDTVQAPTVFLDVLEKLKGQKISYFSERKEDVISVVNECIQKSSFSTEIALENILPDLKTWAEGPGRTYLSDALRWYVNQIETNYNLKRLTSPTFFSMAFCMGWENFALFFQCFPAPVYLNNGTLCRTVSLDSETENEEFVRNFEAATTIWSHRVLYDLLCSETADQINQRCECPLYDACNVKAEIGEEYTCKTAPWEIIKGKNQAQCQYGMAAHSFGLWQNSLEIKVE